MCVVASAFLRLRGAPNCLMPPRFAPKMRACKPTAAIVFALRGAMQMEPETAAGLAHFYAATATRDCPAPEGSRSNASSPPFDMWIREILSRQPGIDHDRWLKAHPIVGEYGKGAKIFFEPPGCAQSSVTLLSSTDKSIAEPIYGDVADKVICDAHATMTTSPCTVLSVGSNGDVAFESAVHQRWPRCAIDVFDGTLTGKREYLRKEIPAYVNFVPRNFGSRSWEAYDGRTVTILKIDCERCEYEALMPWLTHVCTEQVLIEVHAQGFVDDGNRTVQLLAAISQTHAPFFAIHNHRAGVRRGGRYAELAWRRRKPCPRERVL